MGIAYFTLRSSGSSQISGFAKAGAPSGPGPEHHLFAQLLLPLDLGQQEFVPVLRAMHIAGPQFGGQTVTLPIEQQQG